jgi:hypothetical protein
MPLSVLGDAVRAKVRVWINGARHQDGPHVRGGRAFSSGLNSMYFRSKRGKDFDRLCPVGYRSYAAMVRQRPSC